MGRIALRVSIPWITQIPECSSRTCFYTYSLPAAFQLRQAGSSTNVGVNVDLTGSTATQTVAKLTFSGPFTEGTGSLIDGRYTLTVLSDQIQGGLAAGDNVSKLHRLYGDVSAKWSEGHDAVYVARLEESEDRLLTAFENAAAAADRSDVREIILRHLPRVRICHEQMRNLRISLAA